MPGERAETPECWLFLRKLQYMGALHSRASWPRRLQLKHSKRALAGFVIWTVTSPTRWRLSIVAKANLIPSKTQITWDSMRDRDAIMA